MKKTSWRKLFSGAIGIGMALSLVSASGGGPTPQFEEGAGGSGFTGTITKNDYDYPTATMYAALSVTARMDNGTFSSMVKSHVGSNLIGFSYNNPHITYHSQSVTKIGTHYVGFEDFSLVSICAGDLEVSF